ncbi:MAG: M15 family metallopeptidase [Ruminococcus sp.]|nr:M15 family metallopeptidase [Ruminococcus sp.]
MGKDRKKKVHVHKGRVAIAMTCIAFVICIADGLKRNIFIPDTPGSVVVEGEFDKKYDANGQLATMPTTVGGESEPSTDFVQNEGFKEENIPADKVKEGDLVIVNEEHPVNPADKSDLVDLLEFRNEYYTLADEGIYLKKDAAEALNSMMADYNDATGLNDFIVYGTTETFTGTGSYCPRYFQERVTGNTIDLALNGAGMVLSYDGEDDEGWIVDNCYKYGFIVRYPKDKSEKTGEEYCPWHLRYVGKVHAENMHATGMCLEEYVEYLKGYNASAPLKVTVNYADCSIYYIKSEGDITVGLLPIGGAYDISGNNIDGFIITRYN